MGNLLIRGGHVVDPKHERDGVLDVYLREGHIAKIAPAIEAQPDDRVIDAEGMHVLPGLIDLHTHLRDPGFTYKEDIASGTRAAAKGGFTSILCMANTDPVNDNAAVTRYILEKAQHQGAGVRVYPIGAVSKGLLGQELANIGEMREAGVVALSDDGKPVTNSRLLRLAMTYAQSFGLTVFSHSEDLPLVDGGVMNEGAVSTRLGLRGTTHAAEEVMIARDILLSETLDIGIHLCHVSTKGGVQLLREAKARGVKVTAETTPHYLVATDEWVEGYDPMTRVNPPLRSEADRQALIQGLLDGTIDCIATDHAPHHLDEKRVEYPLAASGISGLETAFSLCYNQMVGQVGASLGQLVRWMSLRPAEIASLPGGHLGTDTPGDLVVVDTRQKTTIRAEDFVSKGKNTPFEGKIVQGTVFCTIVQGQVVFQKEEKA